MFSKTHNTLAIAVQQAMVDIPVKLSSQLFHQDIYILYINKIDPNVRKHTEMLRFWNRILNLDESRLTLKMFEYDYKRCKKNWCNDMKQHFNILGEMSRFEAKTSCNIRELQICNNNIWRNKWKTILPNKPKLRTYILFEEQYCAEDYVKLCIARKENVISDTIWYSTTTY